MEDKILTANIKGKIAHTMRYEVISHTNFLDPYQALAAEHTVKNVKHCFFGGYEDAERRMLFLLPEHLEEPERDEYIKLITITPQQADGLGHRDYLGSALGLGIRRDKLGDLLVHDHGCDMIVMADIAEYITQNLDKVARTGAKCDLKSMELLCPTEKELETLRMITASLRLDCMIAGAYQLSRNEAASCISSKKVFVNWKVAEDGSKQVREGDTITLRGRGRFMLQAITGNTKKGRLVVEIVKSRS